MVTKIIIHTYPNTHTCLGCQVGTSVTTRSYGDFFPVELAFDLISALLKKELSIIACNSW